MRKHVNKKIYAIWQGIKNKCHNRNDSRFANLNSKGVVVCDSWKNSYDVFYGKRG